MIRALTALALLAATPAIASDKQMLIAQIEAGGANETEEFRHSVAVKNCEMTTYRWKNLPDHGWTLWSSFKFDMRFVSFANDLTDETEAFLHVPAAENSDGKDLVLVLFSLTHGKTASHEFSILRPLEATEWSARGDGKSFRIRHLNTFFYSHIGPDVVKKAEEFTNAFKLYVRDNCKLLG